jgi:hypothetical protein
VTEQRNRKVEFHVVNLDDGKATTIDGDTSGFGWAIGSGYKPGEEGSDYIESATKSTVTLASRTRHWKEIFVLNLKTKRVEKQETLDYNDKGQKTNRSVRFNPF